MSWLWELPSPAIPVPARTGGEPEADREEPLEQLARLMLKAVAVRVAGSYAGTGLAAGADRDSRRRPGGVGFRGGGEWAWRQPFRTRALG